MFGRNIIVASDALRFDIRSIPLAEPTEFRRSLWIKGARHIGQPSFLVARDDEEDPQERGSTE